jgi:protein-tyrosine phosphatase
MNVSPILGHPERSHEIQKKPKRILEMVHAGAFVQVTAGSFCRHFGERTKRCALEFAKLGAIHAVASDAHSLEKRPPIIKV